MWFLNYIDKYDEPVAVMRFRPLYVILKRVDRKMLLEAVKSFRPLYVILKR